VIGSCDADFLLLLTHTIPGGGFAEWPGGVMPDANFILHLAGAKLFAAPFLCAFCGKRKNPVASDALWAGQYGSDPRQCDDCRKPDASDFRCRTFVPAQGWRECGIWQADLPRRRRVESTPHVLIGLCGAHFSHALLDLLDLLAWLWCLSDPSLFSSRPALAGFRMHGLNKDPTRWPGFLTDMLIVLDLAPGEVWFRDGAVEYRSLYLPRRILPFGPGGVGAPYFRTTRQIGERVVGTAVGSIEKIYLSSRKLLADPRRTQGDGEAQLEALFLAWGFEIIHPQDLSLAEQIRIFRAARYLTGPVGSQLHLAVFCTTPGVQLFRIAPSFFNHDVDAKIMTGVGGAVQTFVVPAVTTAEKDQSLSTWGLDPAVADQVAQAVDAWLGATR
jgi:hypothetical protein